jgi:hypothetical protein
MARPWVARVRSLSAVAAYAAAVTSLDFSRERCPVHIDNKKLDGFLDGLRTRGCAPGTCEACDYCAKWRERCVVVNEAACKNILAMANGLDNGLLDGAHWR